MKTTKEYLGEVIRPPTLSEWLASRHKHNAFLARAWFSEQVRNPWAQCYVYFAPARPGECDGDITIAEDTPAGYQLADTASIPRGATVEQVASLLNTLCERLPLIGLETRMG
jgi:hypothetical protein